MAVSSGGYALTFEKMFIDTAGQSLEAETHKCLMVTDTHTPDFNLDDFRDDVDNEVSGTGYSAGGKAYDTTELTISGGIITYDAADVAWTGSTITSAEAAILYFNVGTAGTDQLILCSDFGSPASTSSGTFTIQWNASGIFTLDLVP